MNDFPAGLFTRYSYAAPGSVNSNAPLSGFRVSWVERVACFCLLIATTTGLRAKPPVTELADLVREAQLIATGEVKTVNAMQTGDAKDQAQNAVAAIELRECIVGCKPGEDVAVIFGLGISENPEFVRGRSYLLFLRLSDGRFSVVRGALGAMVVKGGDVWSVELNDQPQSQDMERLAGSIRKLLVKTGVESILRPP